MEDALYGAMLVTVVETLLFALRHLQRPGKHMGPGSIIGSSAGLGACRTIPFS